MLGFSSRSRVVTEGPKDHCITTYHQPRDDGPFEIRLDEDGEFVPWCEVDPLFPDLEKHPEFVHASPVTLDVEAGDLVYIPSLWYHRFSHNHIGPSIAINYWYDMEFSPLYVAYMLRRELAGMGINKKPNM